MKALAVMIGMVVLVGAVGFIAYSAGAGRLVWTADKVITNEVQLVGNDRDGHGCIGSAGYSWCEIKQKCLRTWEEPCEVEEDTAELIKQALYKKNNWGEEITVTVTLSENDGTYAKGTVSEATGGGGYVFAKKVNGKWEIVADGNGIIECVALEKYPDYPTSYIPECYDSTTQATVKR